MPRRARSHASSSRSTPLLTVAGIGVIGYLLYAVFNKAQAGVGALAAPSNASGSGKSVPASGIAYTPGALSAAVPGVSFAPSSLQPGILASTLTAVPAVTGSQLAQAQSFWSTLAPVQPLDTGYITFPSGSQVAASLMGGGNTAMDGNGNYYVQWAGQVYQLGSQDSSGNWPAMAVASS